MSTKIIEYMLLIHSCHNLISGPFRHPRSRHVRWRQQWSSLNLDFAEIELCRGTFAQVGDTVDTLAKTIQGIDHAVKA